MHALLALLDEYDRGPSNLDSIGEGLLAEAWDLLARSPDTYSEVLVVPGFVRDHDP